MPVGVPVDVPVAVLAGGAGLVAGAAAGADAVLGAGSSAVRVTTPALAARWAWWVVVRCRRGPVGTGVGASAVRAGAGVPGRVRSSGRAACARRGRHTWGGEDDRRAAWVAEAGGAPGRRRTAPASARRSEACGRRRRCGTPVRARLGAAGAACRVWPSTRSTGRPGRRRRGRRAGHDLLDRRGQLGAEDQRRRRRDRREPQQRPEVLALHHGFPRVRLSRVPEPAPREYGHIGQPETLVYPSRLLV